MLVSEIIEYAEDNLVNDTIDGALAKVQTIYDSICGLRPWSFLDKEHSASVASGATYIALPADFTSFPLDPIAGKPLVYLYPAGATEPTPYEVVPFAQKRYYRNAKYVLYLDMRQGRLVSTEPFDQAFTAEFDYVHRPPVLTLSSTPLIPLQFQMILAYELGDKYNIGEAEEKGRSYSPEMTGEAGKILASMEVWDARVKVAI